MLPDESKRQKLGDENPKKDIAWYESKLKFLKEATETSQKSFKAIAALEMPADVVDVHTGDPDNVRLELADGSFTDKLLLTEKMPFLREFDGGVFRCTSEFEFNYSGYDYPSNDLKCHWNLKIHFELASVAPEEELRDLSDDHKQYSANKIREDFKPFTVECDLQCTMDSSDGERSDVTAHTVKVALPKAVEEFHLDDDLLFCVVHEVAEPLCEIEIEQNPRRFTKMACNYYPWSQDAYNLDGEVPVTCLSKASWEYTGYA